MKKVPFVPKLEFDEKDIRILSKSDNATGTKQKLHSNKEHLEDVELKTGCNNSTKDEFDTTAAAVEVDPMIEDAAVETGLTTEDDVASNGKVDDTLETMVCPGDVVFKPTETLLPAWPDC